MPMKTMLVMRSGPSWVASSARDQRARHQQLGDDLAAPEVAPEAERRRGAEAASHGAADLGRHAEREALAVGDEDALDRGAVGEPEQQLPRPVRRARDLGDLRERRCGTRRERLARARPAGSASPRSRATPWR